jgi:hypothetical protein
MLNVALVGDSSLQFQNATKKAPQWTPLRYLADALLQDSGLYWGHAGSFDETPQRLCSHAIAGGDVDAIGAQLNTMASEAQTYEYTEKGVTKTAKLAPPATNNRSLDENWGCAVGVVAVQRPFRPQMEVPAARTLMV